MNKMFLLDNEDFRKKTKEQIAREWAEFEKEQVVEFDRLLIEKGIKKQETTVATNY